MIFPGMDPYLEDPFLWPGVHASLIVYIRDQLQPLLRPRYVAAIEERVFFEGPDHLLGPDVRVQRGQPTSPLPAGTATAEASLPILVEAPDLDIHESYITILDRRSGQQVVTVLEVVSPTNKYAGPGRDSYIAKQQEVRSSSSHLVEMDLLRTGPHVLAVPERYARRQGPYHYLASVCRARSPRYVFELYPWPLQDRIPLIGIPLAEGDPDVALDLQTVLAQAYEMGAYGDRLNYDAPCVPPLSPEDQEWANQLIRQAKEQAAKPQA